MKTERDVALAYKTIFASPEGKIVLADMARLFFLFRSTTGAGAKLDPLTMAFNEGKRTAFLEVLNYLDMKLEPLAILQDVREQLPETLQ